MQHRRLEFNPWVGKIPWRRERLPTPVLENSMDREAQWAIVHGGYKESDTTEQLTHFEDFGQRKRLGSRAGQTWFKSFLTL